MAICARLRYRDVKVNALRGSATTSPGSGQSICVTRTGSLRRIRAISERPLKNIHLDPYSAADIDTQVALKP